MRKLWFAPLPLLLALAGPVRAEEAAPPPGGEVKATGRWILDMTHGPLNTVTWTDAAGHSTAYHYMTLKVTNKTAFAREWRPLVKAIVDTRPTQPYYAKPLAEALDAVRRQERDRDLTLIGETVGKIEPGETKNVVAIFGRLDPLYDRVRVEIHGLVRSNVVYKVEKYTNDRNIIVDSAYWDRNQKIMESLRKDAREANSDRLASPTVEYQEFDERRYWGIDCTRIGDETRAEDSMIRFVSEGWRIEGEPKLLRVVHQQG